MKSAFPLNAVNIGPIAFLVGCLAASLAACGDNESGPVTSRDAQVKDAATLNTADGATDGGSSAPLSVASRTCGRPDIARAHLPKAQVSSWQCSHHDDCSERPNGRCLVYEPGRCTYGQQTAGASCKSDLECAEGKDGHCDFSNAAPPTCFYDGCATNTDCDSGQRCVCPELGGDPWCIWNGCDHDEDCKASQTCRTDDSIRGVGPVQACSTDADECSSSADCKDKTTACGYDHALQHWQCRPITIVD